MTESPENFMNLHHMPRLSTLILIQHPFPRNIQVDIPIVADAKEAITKMNEYVQECSTDKWLNLIKNWKEEHPLKMRPNDLFKSDGYPERDQRTV